MTNPSFADLRGVSPQVVKALAARGIRTPFPIQAQAIPIAMSGRDVLAQAPTGSGKTLAFGLPAISACGVRVRPKPQHTNQHHHPKQSRSGKQHRGQHGAVRAALNALILVPTRELAVQVSEELQIPARAHGLRVTAVYGGANISRQVAAVAASDILVATPGRLIDLIDRKSVRLGAIKLLVLDEADRMLDMGFTPQVERIVKSLPAERQTMLFSATLDGAVRTLVERFTRNPETVKIEATLDEATDVEHLFTSTTRERRVDTLVETLDVERDLAVVFVRTKRGADRLADTLCKRGVSASALHGGLSQSQRLRELKGFRCGKFSTLVATDVFARGIDLDNITHVVNYDPPEDADTYRHRIGRTGRAGRTGTGVSLVMKDQWKHMLAIAEEVGLVEDR